MSSFSQAPGPAGLPIVGVLPQMRRDPLSLFSEARERFGDFVHLKLGPKSAFLLNHPDLFRCVLLEKHASVGRRELYDRLIPILGQGLITAEGAPWRRHRRMLQPVFTPQSLSGFVAAIDLSVSESIGRLEEYAHRSKAFDINQEMQRLTLDIIFRVIFSDRFNNSSLRRSFVYLNDVTSRRLWRMTKIRNYLPLPETLLYEWHRRSLQRTIRALIAERRQVTTDYPDLLGRLLRVRDPDTGEGLTDTEILHEVVTFAFAGHDTTSNALSWAFYLLSHHPEMMDRIYQEASNSSGSEHPNNRSVFAKAFFEETLRLYPPAWFFSRTTLKDLDIKGHRVPEGAMVILSPWVMHRHPDFWDNPLEFRPERFLPQPTPEGGFKGKDPRTLPGRENPAFIPFGLGPHICIGMGLAEMEANGILTGLLKHFTFQLAQRKPAELQAFVTLRQKGNVMLRVTRRN